MISKRIEEDRDREFQFIYDEMYKEISRMIKEGY